MSDLVASVLVITLIFIGLPLFILWVRDRARNSRRRQVHPPERRIAERHALEHQLLHPDWACVERHLQRRVPQALRDLYADQVLIASRDLQYSMDCSISTFERLDEQTIADAKSWLGFEAVAFATTDAGDAIHLRPGASEANTVYLTHHDGGDTEVLSATIEGMLETLRQSNHNP